MRTTKEERVDVARLNNRVLKEVIERAIEEEVANLKLASIDTFKLFQGKIKSLEDVVELIK